MDLKRINGPAFYAMLATEEAAFAFADMRGLLNLELRCTCGCKMVRRARAYAKHGLHFACTNFRSVCRANRSILTGSWFTRHNLTMRQALYAICAYATDMDCRQFSFFAGIQSMNTVVDWRSFFRDICAAQIRERSSSAIGGVGQTVEIDETLVFKRKANTGRLLLGERDHVWVFGGLCRETGEGFLVPVPDRTAETLLAAIHENIAPGSRIISDCWRAYAGLSRHGFSHAAVNHRSDTLA